MEAIMKQVLLALSCTFLVSTAVYADNCESVKSQIAEKIKANGVAQFSLEAVEKGTVTDKQVVGVCGGGTKDIVYQRGVASTTPSQTTEQPAESAQETKNAPATTE